MNAQTGGAQASAAAATSEVPPLDEVDLRITSLDLGDEAVIVTAADGTIVEVNDAFVRVTGYSRDEAIGSTPRLLSSGLQDSDFYRELWDTITSGRVWQGQMVDRRRDGALRTYHSTISPIVDGRGTVTYFVALERDLTAVLGTGPRRDRSGLLHTDLNGRGTYADATAATLLSRHASELLGEGLLNALQTEDADALRELIERAVKTGREHRSDLRTSTGKWIRMAVAPLTVSSGDILGATCVVEDVDDRVAAERAVADQEAIVGSVLDGFDDPIAVVGPDGRIVRTNAAWGAGSADDRGIIRGAGTGDDLQERARLAARSSDGDAAARRLRKDLERAASGVLAPPRRRHGYRVTPLSWDEGGAIVRWMGDDPTA